MTLTAATVKVQYNGDNTTSVYPITFQFWDNSEIVAKLTSSGVDTTWTEGVQYNITGGKGLVGTLTVDFATTDYRPQTGEVLTILSEFPNTQVTALPLGGKFPSISVEQRFDQTVRQIQQIDNKFLRTLKLKDTTTVSDVTLEDPVTGYFLRWKADGTIENSILISAGAASSVDETDSVDTTKDKLINNALAFAWEKISNAVVGVTVASSVNFPQFSGSITTAPVLIEATGSDTNIGITITPKALGDLILDGLKWPQADGSALQFLQTDGSGQLQWTSLSTALPASYISGFQTSNNGTDAVNDIDVGVGSCSDSTDAESIVLASAMTKRIDATWVAGTGNGGRASAVALANGTWYHLFVIKNTSTGDVDLGWDTSLVALNLLSDATGYTVYRRVWSTYYGTATIDAYTQFKDMCTWPAVVSHIAGGAGTTGTATVLRTPLGLVCLSHVEATCDLLSNNAIRYMVLTELTQTNGAPTIANCTVAERASPAGDVWGSDSTDIRLLTDTFSSIRRRSNSDSGVNWYIGTKGYTDFRGSL